MAGWTITCDSGGECPAEIDQVTGLAKFSANTGTKDIIYTITYTDENGNCGSATIRQPGNCSSPGPEPPQPIGVCNFTQSVNNIPYNGFNETVITYNAEQCEASSISATSTTAGVNLLVGDGVITMEVGQGTDTQRTIDVTVKVTIGGEEKTYDFTFIQSGSSPIPTTCGNCPSGDWNAEDDINTVLTNALKCTADEDGNWTPDSKWGNEKITIKIKNDSKYYIPFSGKFKINGYYYFYRNPNGNSNNCDLYWYYGCSTAKGCDTNFLVPPRKTVTLANCIKYETKCGDDTNTYFAFNTLKSGNREGYKLHSYDIGDGVTFSNNTFTISNSIDNDNTIWKNSTYQYVLTRDDIERAHYATFTYVNSYSITVRKFVPVHLNINNVDWGIIKDALDNDNTNEYYPYRID